MTTTTTTTTMHSRRGIAAVAVVLSLGLAGGGAALYSTVESVRADKVTALRADARAERQLARQSRVIAVNREAISALRRQVRELGATPVPVPVPPGAVVAADPTEPRRHPAHAHVRVHHPPASPPARSAPSPSPSCVGLLCVLPPR